VTRAARALYTLVPAGRWRNRGKLAAAAILATVSTAGLYLAVDHPTDQLTALILGWSLAVIVFRLGAGTAVMVTTAIAARRRGRAMGGELPGPGSGGHRAQATRTRTAARRV
jgi:peptidoglycan/LPS O-acetylase OafA/YrhL